MLKNSYILIFSVCLKIVSLAQISYSIDTLPLLPSQGASGFYQVHVAFPYLFYTSVRDTLRSEDIWLTKIDKQGKIISNSQLIGGITSIGTEGNAFYSSRTKMLYYTKEHPKRKYNQFAVAKYHIKKNKATFIRYLSDSINTHDSWNSMLFLSKNEDTLYFASNRKGGKGGTDIWFSIWNKTSKNWQKPKNLSLYNTRFNEYAPFIDYEEGKFYFSSDSLGSMDIYVGSVEHKHKPTLVPEFSNPEYDEKYFVFYKNFGYISRKKTGEMYYHAHFQTYRVTLKPKQ